MTFNGSKHNKNVQGKGREKKLNFMYIREKRERNNNKPPREEKNANELKSRC